MNRNTGASTSRIVSSVAVRTPAATDAIALLGVIRSLTSRSTRSTSIGLTHSTTTSACSTRSWLLATWRTPCRSASAAARPEPRSVTSSLPAMLSSARTQPCTIAPAMLPAPISPRMGSDSPMVRRSVPCPRPPRASGLVEEAALHQHRLVLGGDGHAGGRQQEHAVSDALHRAVKRVGQAAGEIDQPLGQIRLGGLQVDDHRHLGLEAVRDLLGVIVRPRDDQAYLRRGARRLGRMAVADHGARPSARAAAGADHAAGRLLREDVVGLLVAPPRVQPANVRALAVAALEVLVRGGAVVVEVVVVPVLLLDPEVDLGAVPEVTNAHDRTLYRPGGTNPAGGAASDAIWRTAR